MKKSFKKFTAMFLVFTLVGVFSFRTASTVLATDDNSNSDGPEVHHHINVCHEDEDGKWHAENVDEDSWNGNHDKHDFKFEGETDDQDQPKHDSENHEHDGDGWCGDHGPTTATIHATKIVCDAESKLPNWGDGKGPAITSTTATDYVANHAGCSIVPWTFEWAPSNTPDIDDSTGVAGGAWTPFTGTVSVSPADSIWIREQANPAYIPFTGANTDQNVSAELSCHTDHLNYDNRDRVDGITAGNDYYCVAFNVLKEVVPQCGDHTDDIYSDTTDTVGAGNAVATFNSNPAWTAVISGATWIWDTFNVANPTTDETKTFTKTFNIVGTPTSATLDVAADNSYKASINANTDVFADATETNFTLATQDSYNPLAYLNAGSNTISFEVKNWALANGTAENNPAGLLYHLHVVSNDCSPVDETPTGHIIVDKVTDPTQDPTSFHFSTTGTGYNAFDLTDQAAPNNQTVSAAGENSYSVSEDAVSGWNSSVVCVSTNPIKTAISPSSLNLGANETITCTFTNTKVITPLTTSSTGGSGGGGGGGGFKKPAGLVLGAQTSCGIYVDKFLKKGKKGNDADAVKKVQQFLNDYTQAGLTVNGIFDAKTEKALKAFQIAHGDKILKPWNLKLPTGIFYLTTQTEVNNIMCPDLGLPIPTDLIPFSQNPVAPKD